MPTQKEKLQIAQQEISQKEAKIAGLEQEKKGLSEEIVSLHSERDELLGYRTTTEPIFSETKTKLSEAQEKIRLIELSRFASAYKKQEDEYREEQQKWFTYVIYSTLFLTGSIMFSIFSPEHVWYQEPGFYLLDAMFLTLFIYALKKHAYLGNLIVDYANRKTLVQSYQYLVESDEESSELAIKFQEKVTEIVTAIPAVNDGKVTIYEHILDQVMTKLDAIGILKNVTK
jgi:hypothetical protein